MIGSNPQLRVYCILTVILQYFLIKEFFLRAIQLLITSFFAQNKHVLIVKRLLVMLST